jgi:hypothetical protein
LDQSTLLNGLGGLAGAALIGAAVSAVKPLVPDTRFYPLLSVLLGILWNLLVSAALVEAGAVPRLLWASTIILGIMSGLAASGLYKHVEGDVVVKAIKRTPPGTVVP